MKNPQTMEARFNAAREQLVKHPTVDPTRIGAVGYCFGGAVVLNMARAGADLAGVAGFHASLGLNTPPPAPGTVGRGGRFSEGSWGDVLMDPGVPPRRPPSAR
jgi:dienelactone hydrolase